MDSFRPRFFALLTDDKGLRCRFRKEIFCERSEDEGRQRDAVFARNTVDSINAIRELKALGVGVYFEKERVDTFSEKSEQLLTILSSIAQGESESISTNNRWSLVRRFQIGTYIIGDPAYGYCKDSAGNLIIEPKEAAVV